uniref:Uncharacterized protein n=1 Tax=Lotharella globosa TaxID=91324 RepID=A0A7S3YF27_9EUKA
MITIPNQVHSTLLAIVCTVGGVSASVATSGTRDLPADKMLRDWEGEEYTNQVIAQSGGLGIGLGIVFSACMLLHLLCWGHCGKSCRCCWFKFENTRQMAPFRQRESVPGKPGTRPCYYHVFAWACFLLALGGAIAACTSHAEVYTELDVAMSNAQDLFANFNDLQCKGPATALLREGKSLNEIKDMYGGGLYGILGTCDEASIGTLIKQARDGTDAIYPPTVGLIDQMQALVPALDQVVTGIDQMMALSVGINQTVSGLDTLNKAISADVEGLYSSGGDFEGLLPNTTEIPKPDQVDKTAPTAALVPLTKAKAEMTAASDRVKPIVQNTLGVQGKAEVLEAYKNITKQEDKLADQLFQNMAVLNDKMEMVEGYHEDLGQYETILTAIVVIIFTVAVIGLLIMILGFRLRKAWKMSLGAYMIFAVTFWIFVLLGVALAGTMIVHDACGCNGDYSVDGCSTMSELITTNMGSKVAYIGTNEYLIAPAVDGFIRCPKFGDGRVLDYYPNYTNTSNTVDLLDALQEFNLTDETQKAKNIVRSAAVNLTLSPEASQTAVHLRTAATVMSQVSVGVGYDFTQDGQQYAYLFGELASPSAPEYYPANFSQDVNFLNLQRLGRLNVTNRMMETTRNDLIQRTMLFVGTVEVSIENKAESGLGLISVLSLRSSETLP